MRPAFTAFLAALAAALFMLLPGAAAAQGTAGCDLVAAPDGADSAAGSVAAPLRSAQALVGALEPGQVGCFRAGTFGFDELNLDTPGATLTSYPGETAELRGQLRVEREATGAVVENLLLNGANEIDGFSPLVYADGVVIRDNEITNERTTNCVHLSRYYDEPAPANVVIERNRIHDCGGHDPNHDHGIYAAESTALIIRDNLIYDNADRGIQLWPDAQGTQVHGNVIDGNGQGISFGGYEGRSTEHSLVENNIITNSNVRHNVESFWPEDMSPEPNNLVTNNCIHGAEGWYAEADGSGISSQRVGFTVSGNVIADPMYSDRAAHDFSLRAGSPCAGILEGHAGASAISLQSTRPNVPEGARTTLVGTVPDGVRGRVWIMVKRRGNWRQLAGARVEGSRFRMRARVTRTARFKARADGALDSRQVRVAAVAKRKR